MGGLIEDVEAALDHAAGSTDESVARQFDDKKGGGFADKDTWAGVADHAAGTTDEATARSFDDKTGGGLLSGFVDATGDVAFEKKKNDSWDVPGPGAFEVLGLAPWRPGGSKGNKGKNPAKSPPPWVWAVRILAALVAIWALGQLFEIQLGGGSSA